MLERKPLRVLIDGECPLCRREGEFLRRRDAGRGRLLLEDITSDGFDPRRYGLTPAEVMGQIHAVTWDGRILTGMDVFRAAYDAVGLGWLLAPTRWPGLRSVADSAYRFFARNRLRITGRSSGCTAHRCRPA
jgi:predicted DCC family thiol-disulfide oxidoreductase YuxK